MKIVCAPASFKETLSAAEAARAMAAGVASADSSIQCEVMPVGDGGEGTMNALADAMGGEMIGVTVLGPLGEPVPAQFAVIRDLRLAIVELAQASGLMRVPAAKRNPTKTTTFGTGQLIAAAMEHGCDEVMVCIGGSATVDGGTGIAQALGAMFYDERERVIDEPMCGGRLKDVARIDRTSMRLPRVLRVACDVTNPLCGPQGAAAVYGPQKGATPSQVKLLDEGLSHLAKVVGGDANAPGTGAAGGAGFGLANLCGGTLKSGIELVLDAIGFENRCRGAAMVLTGEGRLDAQSLSGKACMGVARRAANLGVPTIAIVGSTGPGADDCTNPQRGGALRKYVSLTDRYNESRARNETAQLLAQVAEELVQETLVGP